MPKIAALRGGAAVYGAGSADGASTDEKIAYGAAGFARETSTKSAAMQYCLVLGQNTIGTFELNHKMTYFVDIFSVETYEEFSQTDKTVTGFHQSRRAWVAKIKPGDKIACYLKGFSCWIGILEVAGALFEAEAGAETIEQYSLQFPTKPLVWLELGQLIPIKRPDVWGALSFTKNVALGSGGWNALLRSSGVRMPDADGAAVEAFLRAQLQNPIPDGITVEDWEKKRGFKITTAQGKTVSVQVPEAEAHDALAAEAAKAEPLDVQGQVRTSHKMQARLAEIGLSMGFEIWIPKADKEAVASEMEDPKLLSQLPSSQFSEPAAKTVEQIDVLWLHKKSIVRAFEVEHTTAIYSGLLRMADLLALQPNFHTKLHIVAPEERRQKVFQELRRPAFAIYNQGSLAKLCTYLPYEKVNELAYNPHLAYLKQEILEELEERAEEAE